MHDVDTYVDAYEKFIKRDEDDPTAVVPNSIDTIFPYAEERVNTVHELFCPKCGETIEARLIAKDITYASDADSLFHYRVISKSCDCPLVAFLDND